MRRNPSFYFLRFTFHAERSAGGFQHANSFAGDGRASQPTPTEPTIISVPIREIREIRVIRDSDIYRTPHAHPRTV